VLGYIARQLLNTIPVLLVMGFAVFSLVHLAPGDPAIVIAGEDAQPADIERIRERLGFDEPLFLQFGMWVGRVLQGDLGTSIFSNRTVSSLILQRLEPTLVLTFTTMVFAVALAVPLGVVAAWTAGSAIDRTVMGLSVLGFSVPVFVLGYAFILVFGVELRWFPVQGYVPLSQGLWPCLASVVMPSMALGLVYVAFIARMTRASLIEILHQDYMRTARAKGLPTLRVLRRHALTNAAVPIVTAIGIGVGLLISGVVVTESVFAIPGLGRLSVDAILRRDYPVIQGVILVFALFYVAVNLVVDVLYTLLDPRIRY
jgi:peptide/nickel transport system permease protein